jgi:HEAT repeat protein
MFVPKMLRNTGVASWYDESRRLLAWVAAAMALVWPMRAPADDDPEFRGKRVTEWLKVLHEDPSPKRQQAALLVLELVGPKSRFVVPGLARELREHPEAAIRAGCATLLGKFKDQAALAVDPLAASVKQDKADAVRESAATALGKMERIALPAVPALTSALADKHAGTRAAAAESLGRLAMVDAESLADSVGPLTKALVDPAPIVRSYAAYALAPLGKIATPAIGPLGDVLMKDKEPSVRKDSAKALAALGPISAPAVPALTKTLADASNRPDVRHHAAIALGAIGPDAVAAMPELIKAFKDADKSVRCFSIYAVGKLGPAGRQALPDLIRVLREDEVAEVRLAVIDQLGALGTDSPDAVDALTVATKDGRPAVREAAVEALKKLRKMP